MLQFEVRNESRTHMSLQRSNELSISPNRSTGGDSQNQRTSGPEHVQKCHRPGTSPRRSESAFTQPWNLPSIVSTDIACSVDSIHGGAWLVDSDVRVVCRLWPTRHPQPALRTCCRVCQPGRLPAGLFGTILVEPGTPCISSGADTTRCVWACLVLAETKETRSSSWDCNATWSCLPSMLLRVAHWQQSLSNTWSADVYKGWDEVLQVRHEQWRFGNLAVWVD